MTEGQGVGCCGSSLAGEKRVLKCSLQKWAPAGTEAGAVWTEGAAVWSVLLSRRSASKPLALTCLQTLLNKPKNTWTTAQDKPCRLSCSCHACLGVCDTHPTPVQTSGWQSPTTNGKKRDDVMRSSDAVLLRVHTNVSEADACGAALTTGMQHETRVQLVQRNPGGDLRTQ